jgi:two-component system response regulator AtoC
MRSIRASLKQLAASDVPVIFQGETGVGKEVLARELHLLSRRAAKPFLKLNCAAVPLELLESELFGYERGAFTGAMTSKPGKFEMAEGGTILLDEIGDMDVKLQAKLLHVLQDSEFQHLGGTETVRVDVRILTATHRDLREEIAAGRFREDLYYRLDVVTIVVPPLRERKEEILPLADFFIARHRTPGVSVPSLGTDLQEALIGYEWPGNVRELENMMRKLLVFGETASLIQDLSEKPNGRTGGRENGAASRGLSLVRGSAEELSTLTEVHREGERAELEAILSALAHSHWNRKRAAALLNIEYKALLYKMKKLGIDAKNGQAAGGAD